MKRIGFTGQHVALFGLVILALAIAGCAAPAVSQAPVSTKAPVAAPTAPTQAPAATTAPAAAAPSGPAMVVATKNDKFGPILLDEKGMTLYLYTKDTKDVSNCYDQCAVNWPPLLSVGPAKAGDGVDAAMLGTTTRKDGSTQVTYNGWPLYYFIKDQKPGDVTGQDVGKVWYVLSPKGEEVMAAAAAMPEPTAGVAAMPAGKTVNVSIKDFSFGASLTVPVGTTVVWTNEDSAPHTVTDGGGAFDSGRLATGKTFSFTFEKAGTFNYTCVYHPNMKGEITATG